MSRILDSMPQSTVVSYPQVIGNCHRKTVRRLYDSQVSVILTPGFKQVTTLLSTPSFATQLLRKEGITVPKLQSSKYRDTTIVMLNWQSEFIHPTTDWKIDVRKTGGLLLFPTTSTSSDMTQPADNIKLITTRHMSKTVTHDNGGLYCSRHADPKQCKW